jgi:predicted RNase H-like nuclease
VIPAGRVRAPCVAGADGCPRGWVAVVLGAGAEWEVAVFAGARELWDACSGAARIFVDIPIGLRDEGGEERPCDVEARRFLGRRGSSVFPAPSRPVLAAASYDEANLINRRQTGRGLSRQTWNIVSKIREFDDLLADVAGARWIVREIHPEVCFRGFAGRPMAQSKKKADGRRERLDLLARLYPPARDLFAQARERWPRRAVGSDDILDALVAALTAAGPPADLRTLSADPARDARGLPMEMVYRSIVPGG